MQGGIKRRSRTRQDGGGNGSNSNRFKSAAPRRNGGDGPGNAKRQYDRYMELARAAQQSGDPVEMENCYQHAEHYLRVMRGQQSQDAQET
jgi:Domain of unknown function (DUF4167)